MTKREILLIVLLASIQFLHIMDLMIVMPLGDVFILDFKIDAAKFSFMVSSYSISAGIFGLLGSVYLDYMDRKKSLLIAFFGFLLGTSLCAMAINYEFMIVGRIVTGCFGGIITSLVLAIVGDEIPQEKRASGMAYVMLGFSFSSVMGVPIGLWLANNYGWRTPFALIVVLGLMLALIVFFKIQSMQKHLEGDYKRKSLLVTGRAILENRVLQKGLLFIFFLVMGQFTVIPFITPYLIRNVHLTYEQIPLIYFVGGAMTLVSAPLIGKMADKYGRKKVFFIVAPLSMLMILIMTNMSVWPLVVVLLINGLMFVTLSGRFVPSNALMTIIAPIHLRGSFMGFVTATINISAGLASLVAGQIIVISKTDATMPVANFNYIGYVAIASSLGAIFIISKIQEKQAV